jgi:hypothetical protein
LAPSVLEREDPRDDVSDRLHELNAVTDVSLGRLDLEEFLRELLLRLRTIADADTAAVLLIPDGGDDLVATAACGIEEEVRQGVHVPIGRGFAGRIAQLRSPVVLDRVDASTVTNPLLWETGIKVMLGVPLLAEGRAIGVLHVGRLSARPFTASDTLLLQVAAERIAGAIQARRLAVEQAAATILERSLMPQRLPEVEGLELAARYIPTAERIVGGDWYDVFTGPSGQLWAVTGDVAGHGLPAAVIVGRVRSALRAYALLGGSPAAVLEHTDRKVHHFEFGAVITVISATSMPPYAEWEIATAGHPPAVVARPGGPSAPVQLPVGPPLGADFEAPRAAATVELPPEGVMVLYTDGLVERRGESLEVSLARLSAAVLLDAPDEVCLFVLHDLIGLETPRDDVALLALRRTAGRR